MFRSIPCHFLFQKQMNFTIIQTHARFKIGPFTALSLHLEFHTQYTLKVFSNRLNG